MKEEEYIYDIGKFTIGVDKNGKDEMVLTIAKVENGEIISLFNCYGDHARCINLLIKENQKLKEKIKQIIEYAYGTDMLVSEYEQLCKIAEVE